MELIIGHFIIPVLLILSLMAFTANFIWKNKEWRLLKSIRIYGTIFFISSVCLYIISIPEAFDNMELGDLTLINNFKNFFNVFYYFLTWVLLPYWVLPLSVFSLIVTLIIIGFRYIFLR